MFPGFFSMVLRVATNVGAGKKGRDVGLTAPANACKLISRCMHVTIHLNWGQFALYRFSAFRFMLCF